MIFPILLLVIAVPLTIKAESQECETCMLLNTTCVNISRLFDLEAPFRTRIVITKIGIQRSRNTLFFSFEPNITDPEYYKTGFVNLDETSSTGIISGEKVLNLGTFDIDQERNHIYFGGNDGIYYLDTNTQKFSSFSSRGDTVTNIFFKSIVYFTRYEERGIIVKNGDMFRTLFDNIKVRKFVVSKYDVFVYLTNIGLYVRKGNLEHRISKNSYFRGLTIDLEDNVYAWWIDGIYKVDIRKDLVHSRLVRIAKIPNIGALTFDNDNNIMFTLDKTLFVMKETLTGCGAVNKE